MFVPVDVVKERLQVSTFSPGTKFGHIHSIQGNISDNADRLFRPRPYRGSLHALVTIFNEEGLRGIYKGYGATVFSYGPFSALYFFFYEQVSQLKLECVNSCLKSFVSLQSKSLWLGVTGSQRRISEDISFVGSLIW